MRSIAIVTPGFKPVPDVRGGAIEYLTTVLIDKNEEYGNFYFDVYTLADPLLDQMKYQCTRLVQVKNYQSFLPIRGLFSVTNRLCRGLHVHKFYDYMSCMMPFYVKETYDLIIVENNMNLFFGLRERFPNVKMVFHIHNDFDTALNDYDKTEDRIRKLERQADMIWTASRYLKRHILSAVESKKIRVLENCIDKNRFSLSEVTEEKSRVIRDRYGMDKSDFVILFSGRFDRWKGTLELLRAVEKMPEKKMVKILLVGGAWFGSKEEAAYCEKVEEMVEKLDGQVIKSGYISQSKMQEVYGMADLVAVPSQCTEAFGMTALEAITMGKPCVASACGGLLDILDENCARLIPIDDDYIDNFSKALFELYKDRELLNCLSEGAVRKSKKFHDIKHYYFLFSELAELALEKNL